MNKTLLITGIDGFVGSSMYRSYQTHYEISGVDISNNNNIPDSSIFSWEGLNNISEHYAIIHLAGKAHDTNNKTSENEYFDVNVGLTKNIFRYFLTSNSEKFIYFSSVKALTDNAGSAELTEEYLPDPKTPYGKSKLEAERYITAEYRKWSEDEIAKGCNSMRKKIYIIRPCMIHGPGNKGNLNLLYKFLQKNLPWPLGAFKNKRSFCSIDNILYIVKRLIDDDIQQGIYNVSDDEPLSTNDLIKLIATATDRNFRIWNVPVPLILFFAGVGDLLNLPLNTERLNKLTESYIVSNKKIKAALKIENLPTEAVAGFQMTIESFK